MRKLLVLCALLLPAYVAVARPAAATPPLPLDVPAPISTASLAPSLQNPNLECGTNGGFVPQAGIRGLVPAGWTALLLDGQPDINSARTYFLGGYCSGGWVEHMEGDDALVMAAQDIETPPDPGKHFDALVYQRVSVTPGQTYSLSAWAVSFCGGSFNNPNDCPAGDYIAKMAGLDPTGGVDPYANTVIWTEDLQNFNVVRWANLRLAATAAPDSSGMTVFLRIRSPFSHHGNHALFDAVSLMAAPTAQFGALPDHVDGRSALITWDGTLSTDILEIPHGAYRLYFDVQQSTQGPDGPWQDLLSHTEERSSQFTSQVASGTYYFQARAMADQPESVIDRAKPNQRYVSEWAKATISFTNHPPLAVDDVVSTPEDSPMQITVLANDSDPDPDFSLSIAGLGPAQHGHLSHDGQVVSYTPDPDFNGSDSFSYTTTDGGLVSAPAVVRLAITPVNDAPRVRNGGPRMNAVGETVWSWLGIYDPEDDPLSISAVGLPPGLALDEGAAVVAGTLSAEALPGIYPTTIVAADPVSSTTVSLDWWVCEQVWRSRLPILARQ